MNNECLAARFLLGEIIAGWTSIDIRSRRPKAELWPDRHDPELQLFPQAPVRSTESQKTVARRQLPCTTPPPAFLRTVAARCEIRGPHLPSPASYEFGIASIRGPPTVRWHSQSSLPPHALLCRCAARATQHL